MVPLGGFFFSFLKFVFFNVFHFLIVFFGVGFFHFLLKFIHVVNNGLWSVCVLNPFSPPSSQKKNVSLREEAGAIKNEGGRISRTTLGQAQYKKVCVFFFWGGESVAGQRPATPSEKYGLFCDFVLALASFLTFGKVNPGPPQTDIF